MPAVVNKKPVLGYSPYESFGSITPFNRVFTGGGQDIKEKGFDGVDAVVLWGGTDIHPSLYGQKHHAWNGASKYDLSERDVFEKKAVLYCKAMGIPLLGVCRGAQLLCAMAGGSLIQHVQGHQHEHHIDTIEGKQMMSTSVHHQMMYPYKVQHKMLAWTSTPRSKLYEDDMGDMPDMHGRQEPEIVYFPQVKGLAIQGHPEYGSATAEYVSYCNKLISEYLLPPF